MKGRRKKHGAVTLETPAGHFAKPFLNSRRDVKVHLKMRKMRTKSYSLLLAAENTFTGTDVPRLQCSCKKIEEWLSELVVL